MKKTFVIGFLCLLVLAPWCIAQEEEKKEGEPQEPDYYVEVEEKALDPELEQTSTKLPTTALKAPVTVGVVSKSLMDSQAAMTLGDALKNVSGVNVQSGFGTFDLFFIRGLDSLSSGLVLTDGAAEPEVTYYQTYNVDRIEVLKGPSAFLYGGNSLSGTAHLIRKQPEYSDLFEVHNSYGSYNSYVGSMDWNYGKSDCDLAFRLNGTWQNSSGYRDEIDGALLAVNPALTWRIDGDSFLNMNFEFVTNEYSPDSGLPLIGDQIADVPRTRSYQSPFDFSEQDIYRVRFDYERRISESITVRNKFYFTNLDWKTDGTLLVGAFPTVNSFAVLRTQTLLDDRQKLTGNQLEAVFSFGTGFAQHKLLSGFELSRLDDDFTLDVALLPPIDLLNPVETATDNPFIIPGASQAGDTRSLVYAPYVVDQITFNDEWQVFAGGRLDVLDYQDQTTSTKREDTRFSPLVGVVYSPLSTLSLYANAGKGFAPPSSLVRGERKPEESAQVEVGIKQSFLDGKLKSSAAFYQIQKENIAIPDDNGITQQSGDIRSRGLEFELSGNPSSSWQTVATYAFNDSELTSFSELIFTGTGGFVVVDRTGNTPAFAPTHILSLWAICDVTSNIRAGGGPRYVSEQFIAEDNAFAMDDYLTFDAYFSYSVQNWRFNVNFKNLTDREYETRGFGSNSIIPAYPFTVYAGIDFSL